MHERERIEQMQRQQLARPVQIHPVARPVQQPVAARPVTQVEQIRQLLGRPVQEPRPVEQIRQELMQQSVARPVQQPTVQQPTVQQPRQEQRDEFRRREFARIYNEVARRRRANESEDVVRAYSDTQINSLNAQFPALPAAQQPVQNPVARPVQQPVPRHERPVQERRSSTYAYDKLVQNELLVQTLRGRGMVVRYDRLNDRFIRVSDNTVYSTLNRASAAHALEVGLSTTPNAWTTFKRLNGSSIDNL
jgi:hypothetical protein